MSKIIMNVDSQSSITINTSTGSSFKSQADTISMTGVEQNSTGGLISNKAAGSLHQINNTMSAADSGQIVNESEGISYQVSNIMDARRGGKIKNAVKKGTAFVSLLVLLGVVADMLGIINFFKPLIQGIGSLRG